MYPLIGSKINTNDANIFELVTLENSSGGTSPEGQACTNHKIQKNYSKTYINKPYKYYNTNETELMKKRLGERTDKYFYGYGKPWVQVLKTEGSNILLKFPELTSDRRKELVKIIHETSEKFKISVRNVRRKFIDVVKDFEKNKTITIDDSKKFQDAIQKSTDSSILKIDENSKLKENEILKV